jgi:hypothetical protein
MTIHPLEMSAGRGILGFCPLWGCIVSLADRFEIESLRNEFNDAGVTGDPDRMAALFTTGGTWRIPAANVHFTGRAEIREGLARLRDLWDFFIQEAHSGTIELDGHQATGRTYVHELGRFRDGTSFTIHGVYHDRYEHTADGWKFAERVNEVLYSDDTPLPGKPGQPPAVVP